MRAAYDYTEEGDGFVNMKEGQIIVVVEKTEPDGWWKGYLEDIDPKPGKQSGPTGMFLSYVAAIDPSSEQEQANETEEPKPRVAREKLPEEERVSMLEEQLVAMPADEKPGQPPKTMTKGKANRKFAPQPGSSGYLTVQAHDVMVITDMGNPAFYKGYLETDLKRQTGNVLGLS